MTDAGADIRAYKIRNIHCRCPPFGGNGMNRLDELHDKMVTTGGNLSPEERDEFERLSFEGMVEQYKEEMKQE